MTERQDVLYKTSVCAELGHPLLAETSLLPKGLLDVRAVGLLLGQYCCYF